MQKNVLKLSAECGKKTHDDIIVLKKKKKTNQWISVPWRRGVND